MTFKGLFQPKLFYDFKIRKVCLPFVWEFASNWGLAHLLGGGKNVYKVLVYWTKRKTVPKVNIIISKSKSVLPLCIVHISSANTSTFPVATSASLYFFNFLFTDVPYPQTPCKSDELATTPSKISYLIGFRSRLALPKSWTLVSYCFYHHQRQRSLFFPFSSSEKWLSLVKSSWADATINKHKIKCCIEIALRAVITSVWTISHNQIYDHSTDSRWQPLLPTWVVHSYATWSYFFPQASMATVIPWQWHYSCIAHPYAWALWAIPSGFTAYISSAVTAFATASVGHLLLFLWSLTVSQLQLLSNVSL